MSNQFYSICNISSTGFPHSVPDALLVSLQIHCFFIVHPWVYPQQNIYMNHTLVENNVDVKACIIFPSATLLHIAISIDFEIIIIKKLLFFFFFPLISCSVPVPCSARVAQLYHVICSYQLASPSTCSPIALSVLIHNPDGAVRTGTLTRY